MVGVAGKSKGCHTCRRRKIKCDETQPHCNKCQQSGRQCEGYQKISVFLNRTPNSLLERGALEKTITARVGSAVLASSLNLTPVWQRRIEEYFLASYVAEVHNDRSPSPGWHVSEIILYMPREPILTAAIEALCLGRVGKMNNDFRMFRRGLEAYSVAARRLQSLLSTGIRAPDAVLAAADLMNLFEFYEPSFASGKAVYDHTFGIERLAHSTGRLHDCRTSGMRGLLAAARYNSMIVCLKGFASGSPLEVIDNSLLSKKSLESIEHTMYDIGFLIARALRNYQELKSSQLLTKLPILIDQCIDANEQLQTWWQHLSEVIGTPLWWYGNTQGVLSDLGHRPLMFSHISVAHRLLDYWCLNVIFGRMVEQLSLVMNDRGHGAIDVTVLTELASRHNTSAQLQMAIYIIASSDYCIRKDVGLAGKQRQLFGLAITIRLFRMLGGPQAKALEQKATQILTDMANEGLHFARCVITQVKEELPDGCEAPDVIFASADTPWGLSYARRYAARITSNTSIDNISV